MLVADLDEGMGTLQHAGSERNPAFGLWPLSQALVLAVRSQLEIREGREEERQGTEEEETAGENATTTSLSAFLGESNDDADWEVVEAPPVVNEKFVLVGKREVNDICSRAQPEWV